MRKALTAALLALTLLLTGCAPAVAERAPGPRRFEATFLELFDTVTTVVGYADSEEAFQAEVQALREELETYHQLYDIYHTYDGLHNLKTVNDNAGIAPVEVDSRIIDLLEFCGELYAESDGRVNAAMGSVLRLWHESRTAGVNDPANAVLPDPAALEAAMDHMDFSGVVIDRAASTVYLPDPDQSLDVGAVAKGYALERACQGVEANLIVSLGGNVRVTGPKADGSAWVVGVQDPDGGADYLHTLRVPEGSVVTSGDYQRTYTVDGIRYHHLIDPATGYPAGRYRAVTILCRDSGLADGLSTALFLMTREEGEALLAAHGAEALWVLPDGSQEMTPGFQEMIRNN